MASRKQTFNDDFQPVPLATDGGMWSGGDAALIPQNSLRKIRNMFYRAGPLVQRPQFTYDGVTNVRGLGVWHDTANGKRRLMSVDSSDVVRVKATTGETWSASVGTITGDGVVLDSTSSRGKWYCVVGTSARAPSRFAVYNGTAISALSLDGLQATGFLPHSVTQYKGRLFFGGATINVYNWLRQSTNHVYDASTWTLTNVTSGNIVSGGVTLCRITPTNNTTASLQISDVIGISSTNVPGRGDTFSWRCPLRNTDPSYRVPMTLQLKYVEPAWGVNTAYLAGNFVVPGNGYIYRCKVAGTSDPATEPVWSTTVGAENIDNTVTWICDATDIAQQRKIFVSDTVNFTVTTPSAKAPDGIVGQIYVATRLMFGHDGAAFTRTSLDFSLKDGKADNDSTKRNEGQQFTMGTFQPPFYNIEGGNTAALDHSDYLYWTLVGEDRVEATAYYLVQDQPGPITAVQEVDGRLCVFKRNSITPFSAVEDPRLVVLPEGSARVGFGALNARALKIGPDGFAYFVGENEFYRWKLDREQPDELCGDAMRDEIMNQSSASWVESQSFPANAALLDIDPALKLAYLYTQKGIIHVMDLVSRRWSVFDAGGDTSVSPIGKQVCDLAHNPNTKNLVVAFTEAAAGTPGIARMDALMAGTQDSISTSGTSQVHAEVWKTIELTAPRYELLLDYINAYHAVTASQAGQTTTAYVSSDQGVTFPNNLSVTLSPLSTGEREPMRLDLYQSGGSLTVRLLHSGSGGASNFNLSRMEAYIAVLSGEYTRSLPTVISSSL